MFSFLDCQHVIIGFSGILISKQRTYMTVPLIKTRLSHRVVLAFLLNHPMCMTILPPNAPT